MKIEQRLATLVQWVSKSREEKKKVSLLFSYFLSTSVKLKLNKKMPSVKNESRGLHELHDHFLGGTNPVALSANMNLYLLKLVFTHRR